MAASAHQHIYDWLRARGYWLPTAARDGAYAASAEPTHLLLDGGKARVPDESHGEFLNAYAVSLLRFPQRRPCVVELRTPVFKMFLDLDTRFATVAAAEQARSGCGGGLLGALACIGRVVDGCVGDSCAALVCASSSAKAEEDGSVKLGFHVVWPDVPVTAATALELRRQMLVALGEGHPPEGAGLVGRWETTIDACVFRANGLRMPWSGKGRGDGRFYALRWVLRAGELEPRDISALSAVREALRSLSIRSPSSTQPVLHLSAPDGGSDQQQPERGKPCHAALEAYSDVLPRLAASLPIEFLGQRFTGLVETDHCFMLRSTARFCINLGRAHRTNNVYFLLSKRGVSQRCFCRCETTEGRKYGLCKDFSSPCWEVPKEVLDAFFPGGGGGDTDAAAASAAEPPPPPASVSAMPSRVAKSFLSLEALMARSRPQLHSRVKRQKA